MEAVITQSRSARLRKAGLPVAALAVLGLSLAACGSSGSSSDPSSSAPAAGSSSGSSQSGGLAFAQCVRAHGVPNMPDPQNGRFLLPSSLENNPNWQSALQACGSLMGPGGVGGNGSNNSAILSYARCMQTHGEPQFPDPESNGAIDMPKSIDPNSPTYQKAAQECQPYRPGGQGQS